MRTRNGGFGVILISVRIGLSGAGCSGSLDQAPVEDPSGSPPSAWDGCCGPE